MKKESTMGCQMATPMYRRVPGYIPDHDKLSGVVQSDDRCKTQENLITLQSEVPWEFIPPRHPFTRSVHSGTPSLLSNTQRGKSVSSSVTDYIWKLTPNDIVCGRGAPTCDHPGNQLYRRLVKKYQMVYLCANRREKPQIAMKVLEAIRAGSGGCGRFVRRIKTTRILSSSTSSMVTNQKNGFECCKFAWEEIEEKRAYEKVCQSLREGAPELRRKMMISSLDVGCRHGREQKEGDDENEKENLRCH